MTNAAADALRESPVEHGRAVFVALRDLTFGKGHSAASIDLTTDTVIGDPESGYEIRLSSAALEDMMAHDRVQRALESRIIEIAPLAYMRGRTLSDAFIILDEAQNATGAQMKMFLTRLGANSRTVVTGDKTQIDLPRREDSGLVQIERILPGIDGVAFCYLDDADVIRHRLVREIIRAYAQDQNG